MKNQVFYSFFLIFALLNYPGFSQSHLNPETSLKSSEFDPQAETCMNLRDVRLYAEISSDNNLSNSMLFYSVLSLVFTPYKICFLYYGVDPAIVYLVDHPVFSIYSIVLITMIRAYIILDVLSIFGKDVSIIFKSIFNPIFNACFSSPLPKDLLNRKLCYL